MGSPPRRKSLGLSIAEVSRRTGISPSTLRFYEREMPGLFLIRKTPGGHRRYGPEDVERFSAIRRLTETDAVPLAQVRRVLASRGDHEPLREEVERLRAAREQDGWTLAELGRRVASLEEKLALLGAAPPGKKRWFGKKP
ncbi:MAG TPA: MerR family transcriptional regulator [Thermoanaerobaculia bacterium]